MKKKQSKGELRHKQILEVLKTKGELSVVEIMEEFSCSEATARRDLNYLAKTENIIRTLGGAHYESVGENEFSFREKQQIQLNEKNLIAMKAASLIQEGDIVGLTGGTTTFLIAKHLKSMQNITVVTNAVNIAMELADNDRIQTVLTGGVIRTKSFELCGPLAETIIEQLNIGKMFVGINGFSIDKGLTTYSELEAQIGKLMIKRASEVIAVFDHTKVNLASLFTIAPLNTLTACITDIPLDRDLHQVLVNANVKMYYPDTHL